MAAAEAVPQVFGGRDDQRRAVVVMQHAQADEVFALRLELDAVGPHQLGEVGVSFQPLELVFWNSGHKTASSQKPVNVYFDVLDVDYSDVLRFVNEEALMIGQATSEMWRWIVADFGKNLAKLRKRRMLTQLQLADIARRTASPDLQVGNWRDKAAVRPCGQARQGPRGQP